MDVTDALCDELPKLPAEKQVLLANTLGQRGDASAGPALLALASKAPDAVRLAAVRNLTRLGYAPALPLLAELSLTGEANLAAAARTCLANFPAKDADATILAMLTQRDARIRSLAVQMIGQRNIAGSNVGLLKTAVEDSDQIVRLAAFKALRNIPTVDALALVAAQLDNPLVKEEACVAAVTIAEKLVGSQDPRVTAAMKRVAKVTANKALAARASAIARQAAK